MRGKRIEKNLYCPLHGHITTQELTYVRRVKSAGDRTEGGASPRIRFTKYYSADCKQGDLLLYSREEHDSAKSVPSEFELLWPDPRVLPRSVPLEVQQSWEQAKKARNDNPDTFGFHIRRGLEAVCDDCGIPRFGINTKGKPYPIKLPVRIKQLVEQRQLPEVMKQMMNRLTKWGNDAVHNHLEPRLVPHVDLFFNAIVNYVYVWPHMLSDILDDIKQVTATEI